LRSGKREGKKEKEGGGKGFFPSLPFLSRRLPPGLLRDFSVTEKPKTRINARINDSRLY